MSTHTNMLDALLDTGAERDRRLTIARAEAMLRAEENLIDFARYVRPDPNDVEDVSRSIYIPARHHRAIAAVLEEVEKGKIPRLILNVPPRHGKSELAAKSFIPWFMGRNPALSVVLGTYNVQFSWDYGRAVGGIMSTPAYHQVFPEANIVQASVDRLELAQGGTAFFTGLGGTITGRGGDLLLIDDPIKNREEADNLNVRNKLWDWFANVLMSRAMRDTVRVILIQTRWHEDDLVGRLTDPRNPNFDAEEARTWKVIDLPALARDNDPFGRKLDEPLWPERFSKKWLEGQRRLDSRGFSALYQGRPAPEEGSFFRAEDLKTYDREHLPKDLRYYIASDHAVSEAQNRDKTCMIPVGVDSKGVIWVLPDIWWRQGNSKVVTEAMLQLMKRYKPLIWWAEKGHITKSIGPFLRERMRDEEIYIRMDEIVPVKDKQTRAQSIQGRVSLHTVRFPRFAPWWEDAKHELLSFPQGTHDDFVDALAYIGLGLTKQQKAEAPLKVMSTAPKPGTLGWVKAQTRGLEERRQLEQSSLGW